jgi:hypothetical protein
MSIRKVEARVLQCKDDGATIVLAIYRMVAYALVTTTRSDTRGGHGLLKLASLVHFLIPFYPFASLPIPEFKAYNNIIRAASRIQLVILCRVKMARLGKARSQVFICCQSL